MSGDKSVSIQVIHGECPPELLFQFASGRHRKRAKELPEVDGAVVVGVEGAENVFCEFGGVAIREKIAVDLNYINV